MKDTTKASSIRALAFVVLIVAGALAVYMAASSGGIGICDGCRIDVGYTSIAKEDRTMIVCGPCLRGFAAGGWEPVE